MISYSLPTLVQELRQLAIVAGDQLLVEDYPKIYLGSRPVFH
jgi:hypothetical protein